MKKNSHYPEFILLVYTNQLLKIPSMTGGAGGGGGGGGGGNLSQLVYLTPHPDFDL